MNKGISAQACIILMALINIMWIYMWGVCVYLPLKQI